MNDFTRPGSILRPFPEPEDVFVPDQTALLARHLHPLMSIDLSAANPAWSGWLHLISPIEPYTGLLGEHGQAYYTDHQTENMLMFQIEDGRYRLLGDPRFLLMEQDRAALPPASQTAYDELAEHYLSAEASYRRSKASWRKHGLLYWLNDAGEIQPPGRDPSPLLDQLGGMAGDANWCTTAHFPIDPPQDEGDDYPEAVWPISPAGRRFELVATTSGYPWRSDGADSILLFYEPHDQLALFTFDWS